MSKRFVTAEQFVNEVSIVPGAAFLGALLRTEPELLKKRRDDKAIRPFKTLIKLSLITGQINAHYDKAVLRDLVKESKLPEFVREMLDGGASVDTIFTEIYLRGINNPFERGETWHCPARDAQGRLTPFARHKTESRRLYLRVNREHLQACEYFADGLATTLETVRPWLKSSGAASNQGLDEPVRFRTIALESLLTVTVRGEEFIFGQRLADRT